MDLPDGQPYAWFEDANVVYVSPWLCAEARQRVKRECEAKWQQRLLLQLADRTA